MNANSVPLRVFIRILAFLLAFGAINTGVSQAIPGPVTPASPAPVDDSTGLQVARHYISSRAYEFGISAEQFEPVVEVPGLDGVRTFRFEQSVAGIPVLGSLISVTISKSDQVLSASVTASNVSIPIVPKLSKNQAERKIRINISEIEKASPSSVSVTETKLVIIDGALTGDYSIGQQLAWRSRTMVNEDLSTLSDTLVSDQTGEVISSIAWIRNLDDTDPYVCDMQTTTGTYSLVPGVRDTGNARYMDVRSNTTTRFPLCGPNTSGSGDPTTATAFANIQQTQDFFNNYLGIDINEEKYLGNISVGLNGNETPRISAFTNVCAQTTNTRFECPFENAFWVPWSTPVSTTPDAEECRSTACSGIYFGNMDGGYGLDIADDVVAHELSHGVTFSLAFYMGLEEKTETAALSEAVSDIFGEATDQMTVATGEGADSSWKLGESVVSGGFRNMRNPEQGYSRVTSSWKISDSHQSSGPINRLAWLLANGGTSGTTRIKAIGSVPADGLCNTASECTAVTRTAALTLATVSKLTPSSNFFDFGRAMIQSCQDFVKNQTAGFKASTCTNVAAALKAQGITQFSIKKLTNLKTVKHGKPATISAYVTSLSGSPVVGQTMKVQEWKKSKWVTIATPKPVKTNSHGKVSFKVTWAKPKKSVKYRIITSTNGGLLKYATKSESVKVS